MCALEHPLVTVIVPVFDVETFVSECLESICNQTYRNLEILCIDDCGEDSSVEIIKKLQKRDGRIKILKNRYNLGQGYSRNVGISSSKGDFIYFVDSDDWIERGTIRELVKKAIIEQSDIVVGDFNAFNDENIDSLICVANTFNSYPRLRNLPERVTVENFECALREIPSIAWGKLYRKKFLVENNLRFISRKLRHEDEGFHVKCLSCNPCLSVVHSKNYHYRIRANSEMQFNDGLIKGAISDMRDVIYDALCYLREKNAIYSVVTRDRYHDCFTFRCAKFVFYWGRNKLIKIGFIQLFKYIENEFEKKLKIFGLTVWRKKKKYN